MWNVRGAHAIVLLLLCYYVRKPHVVGQVTILRGVEAGEASLSAGRKSEQNSLRERGGSYKERMQRISDKSGTEEENTKTRKNMLRSAESAITSKHSTNLDIDKGEPRHAETRATNSLLISKEVCEGSCAHDATVSSENSAPTQPEGDREHDTTQSEGDGEHDATQPEGGGEHDATQPEGDGEHDATQPEGDGEHDTTQPDGDREHDATQPEGDGEHDATQPDGDGEHGATQPEGDGGVVSDTSSGQAGSDQGGSGEKVVTRLAEEEEGGLGETGTKYPGSGGNEHSDAMLGDNAVLKHLIDETEEFTVSFNNAIHRAKKSCVPSGPMASICRQDFARLRSMVLKILNAVTLSGDGTLVEGDVSGMEDKGAAVDYGYSSRGGSATDQNDRESYILSSQDSRHSPSSGSSADDNFSRNKLFRVPDKWTWIFTLLSIAVVSLGGSLYRCFKGTGERVKAGLNPDDVKCCEAAGGADVAPQTPEVCTRAAPSPAPHPVKNDAPPVFGASAGGNTFSPPSVRRSFIPRLPVAKQPDMRLGGTAQVLRSPMQVERADDISCSRGPPPQERVSPPFTQCGMLRVTTPTSEEQRNSGPNPSDVLVNPFLQRWSR